MHMRVWAAFVTILSVAYASDGFYEEPSNQTVHAGNTVTLSCFLRPPRQSSYLYVYWYKSFGFSDLPTMPISSRRVTNANVDERYSIVGSDNRYDLQITNVEVGDTSYYMCKYYTGDYFDSQIAHLVVYDNTLVPQCRFHPHNPDVGTRVTIRCLPGSGDSSQSLTLWRGQNGHQITNVARQPNGAITHRFPLKANDNNRSYTCVFGRNFKNIHNCSVTPLTVAPTISLTPAVTVGILDDTVRFSCFARGLPKFTTYKWVVGTGPTSLRISESVGRYIHSTNGESARLTITHLKTSDNNTAVRCIATNSLGHRVTALGKVIVQALPITPSETMRPDVVTSTTPYFVFTTESQFVSEGLPWKNIPIVTEAKKPFIFKSDPDMGHENESVEGDGKIEKKNSRNSQPSSRLIKVLVPILLIVAFLLVVLIIILLFYIRKTDKESPKTLKRMSLNKPEILKRMSISRPQFLDNVSLRKSWQDAKQKVEALQKRASRRSRQADEEKEKRQSLRDQIEVVVNPPPPEWQLKVEDVDKAQRQRMLSYHAPSSGYSSKEKDLLNSLLTGKIKMKTLENKPTAAGEGVKIENEDADSQLESDFEDDFEEASEAERGSTEKTIPPVKKEKKVPSVKKEKTVSSLKKENKNIVRKIPDGKRTNDSSSASKGGSSSVKRKEVENGSKGTEVIYANSNVVPKSDTATNGAVQGSNSSVLAYAELDLKLTGPWDESRLSQSEAKTAYAVIDHTKKDPKVASLCE